MSGEWILGDDDFNDEAFAAFVWCLCKEVWPR